MFIQFVDNTKLGGPVHAQQHGCPPEGSIQVGGMGNELNMSQQCPLTAQTVDNIKAGIKRSTASRCSALIRPYLEYCVQFN